ncbi:hypothetical protein CN918_32475 [Priestia megaterium]|nr:hypothetical protein CN918_32475 [Priestia megaterium]
MFPLLRNFGEDRVFFLCLMSKKAIYFPHFFKYLHKISCILLFFYVNFRQEYGYWRFTRMSELLKKTRKFAKELVDKDLCEEEFEKRAKKLEAMRKFKTKDYKEVIIQLQSHKLDLYDQSGGNINKVESSIINEGLKLIERTQVLRKEYNSRTTSKVDTNILTGGPFFAGGNKARKNAKANGAPSVVFEQGGIHRITYENPKGHLLTMADAKVFVALVDLWEKNGRPEWLRFSEHKLLKILNSSLGGEQYRMLRESLNKLRYTSIILQEAHDVKTGKEVTTFRFPLIMAEKLVTNEDEHGNIKSKRHDIQFSPYIYNSMKFGYYSFVSLPLSDEIESNTARAIYYMLCGISTMEGKEKYIREENESKIYTIPVDELYAQLKLENPKPARNKAAVQKACEQLVEHEILKSFNWLKNGRYTTDLQLTPSNWILSTMMKNLSKEISSPVVEETQLTLTGV